MAQLNFGKMLETGSGVPKNAIEASLWYKLAALGFQNNDTNQQSEAIRAHDRIMNAFSIEEKQVYNKMETSWLIARSKK